MLYKREGILPLLILHDLNKACIKAALIQSNGKGEHNTNIVML